jgi:hypothetical protein
MPLRVMDAALRYAGQGWPVLPVNGKLPLTAHGYKDGTTDPDEIRRLWHEHPAAGVGAVVGEQSGLCVLDVDPRSGGDAGLARLIEEHGPLPETMTVATAGGGKHFYFRYAEAAESMTIAPGLELKARNGYVVAPPSHNPKTGNMYRWITGKGVPIADLPAFLVVPRRSMMVNGAMIPEGMRNVELASLAGAMRKRGMTEDAIRAALLAENRARCVPPLPEYEVQGIAHSVARYPAGDAMTSVEPRVWPDLPAAAAYHGLAGEFVHLIEEHTEADPAALLAQFLVGFGNVIDRGPHFIVEADHHHTNEFALLVGESSRGRKGTAWGNARRPLHAADPEWSDLRQQSGLSSGEGLIWAVRDPILGRSPIREKGRIAGYEEVEEDPGIADKRLLVFEPEFASTLRVMAREGSTLSSVVRQSWDTGTLRVLTKKQAARATDAHISIIGHITRDELLRYLDRTEAANGFINRFMIVCTRRSRILPEGGRLHELDFHPLNASVQRAVEWSRGRAELKRDESARELWHDVYPDLSAGRPGLFGSVVSRAEAHVVRLSLLYALLDGADRIGRPHLEAALALWRYAEASARHVFGDALGDPVVDELLATLRAHPGGLTRTEISGHFGRHRRAGEIGRALTALLGRSLVRSERLTTGGREAERWYALGSAKEAKEVNEVVAVADVDSLPSLVSPSDGKAEAVPTPDDSHLSHVSQSGEPADTVVEADDQSLAQEGTWVG